MKLKSIVLAAALVASGLASANPINTVSTTELFAAVTSPTTAVGSAFNVGAFTDTFTFGLDPVGQFSVSLTNSFTSDGTGFISFYSAMLAGPGLPSTALSLTSPSLLSQQLSNLFPTLPGGSYTLTVMGLAPSTGATYGMSAAAVVPEPETYAMLLAGLGVVGFMAKRRKVA